jgi:hypothetical protein
VLKALTELRKKGVFAAAVVKKRKYWPKFIDGEAVKLHFQEKAVGDTDCLNGNLNNVPFHVMGLKEAPYVMTMMSTYGTLERVGKETERNIGPSNRREKIKFHYPEVFGNHFKYRHMVDDHNARRHAPISFEENWATKTWTQRVFAFLLSVSEVNAQLLMKYFYKSEDVSQITFRKALSYELINNKYLIHEQSENIRKSRRQSESQDHEWATLPPFKKFKQGKLQTSNMKYGQFKCVGCKKRTRKYCKCTPGQYLCQECYADHKKEVGNVVQS